MTDIPVAELPNIGTRLARRLTSAGIHTRKQLADIGAPAAYQRLCQNEHRRLPVCYNLYSLEAALKGHDWRLLEPAEKLRLKDAAGVD